MALAFPSGARGACTVATQGMAFGAYDPLAPADLPGYGAVEIDCDEKTSVQVSLWGGSGASTRYMRAPSGDAMAYRIHPDASRTTVWTNTVFRTVSVPKNRATAVGVYGSVAAGQDVGAGTYTDALTAYVVF